MRAGSQPELLRLARLLGRDPSELSYLASVPPADLRLLREQVADMLLMAHAPALSRLAAAAKVLPAALVATISERALGPLLCAQIAAMLEPARAIEVAARLSAAFLAEVAVDIDPRLTAEVIARVPPARVAEITRELVQRGEYLTIAGFVGHLCEEAIAAALEVLDDGTLERISSLLENQERQMLLAGVASQLEERDGTLSRRSGSRPAAGAP